MLDKNLLTISKNMSCKAETVINYWIDKEYDAVNLPSRLCDYHFCRVLVELPPKWCVHQL